MNRTQAEEHLRVIRSLMEKATIYRAISAPTALVGGVLSIVVGLILHFQWDRTRIAATSARDVFLGAWLVVLALTGAVNGWFIHREAKRRGEKFVSAGMRKALWALFPSLLCGAAFTLFFMNDHRLLPAFWMIFYGLALLATTHFSPQAIPRLGWAFLFAGLVVLGLAFDGYSQFSGSVVASPNLLMLITFGGFHLAYAACTWGRCEVSGD
jgi:uncharacterized membrane protein